MRHPAVISASDQVDELNRLHWPPEVTGDVGDLDAFVSDLSVADNGDEVIAALVA